MFLCKDFGGDTILYVSSWQSRKFQKHKWKIFCLCFLYVPTQPVAVLTCRCQIPFHERAVHTYATQISCIFALHHNIECDVSVLWGNILHVNLKFIFLPHKNSPCSTVSQPIFILVVEMKNEWNCLPAWRHWKVFKNDLFLLSTYLQFNAEDYLSGIWDAYTEKKHDPLSPGRLCGHSHQASAISHHYYSSHAH